MRTFSEFMSLCEASDADAAKQLGWGGGASITRQGEGGRIGRLRKKTAPERRRMKAVGGGKMVPVEYKPRKDIGTSKPRSQREQQPEQERGSKQVTQSYAEKVKAERRAAAKARIAARQGGKPASTSSAPRARDAEKQATKLLSTKKPEAEKPASSAPKKPPSGKTRAERDKERNAAMRAAYNKKKAQVFADYEKVHGSPPKGKERTKLIGLINREAPAHPSSAAKHSSN